MSAAKGFRPPNAGIGRPKGVPNKLTQDVKAMILGALSGLGGMDYLMEQGQKNPGAFMTLVGKVLPMQVTGANDGPVMIITGVARAKDLEDEQGASEASSTSSHDEAP